MKNLEVSDIFNETEEKNLLSTKEKPHIENEIFNIQQHLMAILDNMGQKFIVKDQNDNNLEKKYSLMDVRNFRLLNSESIKELFIKGFGINIESEKGLNELNNFYHEAKKIFCERYGKNLPYNLRKDIHNVDEIQNIFKSTGSTLHGVYYCALSKLFYGYASFMKDIRISKKDEIHEEITNYLGKSIHSKEEVSEGRVDGKIKIGDNNLGVHFSHRAKSIDSIVGKAAGSIDYNEVDDYKDLHGYTLEVDTQNDHDIILLMQQYYLKILPKVEYRTNKLGIEEAQIEIENKNMIETRVSENGELYIPALEDLKKQLDPNFYEILKKSIILSEIKSKNKAKNKNTDHKYQDIKFKIKYGTNDPRGKELEDLYSGVEIKFIKKGNENEKGTALHSVFDYSKRFRELTRLVGYIRHTDIINFVNDFFNNLDEVLRYKSMRRGPYLEDLLFDLKQKGFIGNNIEYKIGCSESELEIRKGLYKMYESTLMKVKSSKNARKHFYIHPSYFDLVPEIQPELYEI